jgi:hypothetical protein
MPFQVLAGSRPEVFRDGFGYSSSISLPEQLYNRSGTIESIGPFLFPFVPSDVYLLNFRDPLFHWADRANIM